MNKLFTKIVGGALGLTMAIGVGVAVASNREAVPVHAADATGTLTITRSCFPSGSLAYNVTDDWSATCSPSSDGSVSGQGDLYSTAVQTTMQTKDTNVSTHYHNTTAMPGYITGITLSLASGNDRTYTVRASKSSAITSTSGGTQLGTMTAGSKFTTNLTKTNDYRYFWLTCTGGASFLNNIVIDYSVPVTKTLESISIAGYKTTFVKNDTFSFGGTVSAHYDDKSTEDVTSSATFSGYNMSTTGNQTVTVTYSGKTTTYDIFVDAVSSLAITGSMTKTTYTQGEAWDPAGFTVKAYYASDPSTPVDVTNNAGLSWSYSPAPTALTSTTSVTCTASFGEKSATSSAQSVTVNKKPNLGGLTEGRFFLIVGGHVLKASTFAVKGADTYTTADDSVDGLSESDAWYFAPTDTDNRWTIRVSDADNANYLYATNTNNGLVSGKTSDSWTVENGTGTYAGKLVMKDTINSRYISYSTSSDSYIRVYTNTDNGDCAVRFVKYEKPVTLDSLTISGATSTFTAGDYFSLGSPTITATYSTGDKSIAANDSGLSFKLGGNAITTSTRLTSSDNGKSLVVRYTDSENRYADATGYTLTVNPKPVQSVTLDKASATIAKGGTVQLTATVSDEYAIQTVKWTTSNSSIATVSAATSTSGNAITVTGSSSNAGSATITAYVDENDNGSLDSGEKSATCAITVSGDPVLNMLDDEENVISGQSLHAFTTDSKIYLHVDAQNFVGAITYTWSSSNTSAIAIEEEADEMCEFDIVGAGTNVRLSCHAVGATSGDLTTYVDYTVAEPQVDQVTWSAPATLSVYSNASLTAANITSWSPAYHKDNGESGSISSGYTVKLGGTTISLSHPWDVEDDGEELWIEYGGIASSHVTVQVTEHLNPISYSSWQRVTSISAGDTIVLGNGAKGEFMTSTIPATGTLGVVSGTVTDGVCTDMPSSAVKFTVGGSSGAWTLQDESGNYLSVSTTAKTNLYLQEDSATVAISFSETSAIFGDSSGYRIVLNTSASSHRFSTYDSGLSASMVLPEIYKSTTSDITDTNATAQRALLGYVATFNSTMDCEDDGSTTNVESKWSTLAETFTNTMNGLESDDKTVFKRLVANASAVEGGDSLQDMLARYDYIIAKYKISNDFLHDGADRGAVQYARVTPFNIIGNNGNTVAIIVVVSMISIASIGGYFFLRKRKEY